jgi:hypothetical protein
MTFKTVEAATSAVSNTWAEEGDSSPSHFKWSLLEMLLEGLTHHGAG